MVGIGWLLIETVLLLFKSDLFVLADLVGDTEVVAGGVVGIRNQILTSSPAFKNDGYKHSAVTQKNA